MVDVLVKLIVMFFFFQNTLFASFHLYRKLVDEYELTDVSLNPVKDEERESYILAIVHTISYLEVLERHEKADTQGIFDAIEYSTPEEPYKIWRVLKNKSLAKGTYFPSELYVTLRDYLKFELEVENPSTESLKELCKSIKYQRRNIEKFKIRTIDLRINTEYWKNVMNVNDIKKLSKPLRIPKNCIEPCVIL